MKTTVNLTLEEQLKLQYKVMSEDTQYIRVLERSLIKKTLENDALLKEIDHLKFNLNDIIK